MLELGRSADRLLRGQWSTREQLAQGRVGFSLATLVSLGAAGGALYGAAMGLYGVLRPAHATWQQMLANAVKVPLLFLATLLVAFPSLYAFSALADSKLRFYDTLKLALVAVAVTLVLIASFAPVTAFFTVSTTSYPFMVLLNVALFALAGAVGLRVLSRALGAVYGEPELARELVTSHEPSSEIVREHEPSPEVSDERRREREAARERARPNARPRRVFLAWFVIYGLVGSQMGWILRPFIGAPGLEFQLFRERGGSFFEAVFTALAKFLSGA